MFLGSRKQLDFIINNSTSETSMHLRLSFRLSFSGLQFYTDSRKQEAEWSSGSTCLTHIVISADTDQYERIYCNICGHIAQPQCDVFDRVHRPGRSEALQYHCIDTQFAVSTSDEIECEMLLVLLARLPSCSRIHLWLRKCDWMFPWFASYLLPYI